MKEQVLEFLNNELVSYIIECVAIFLSVVGGIALLLKKIKEVLDKVIVLFKDANDTTAKTNQKLDNVTEDNKAVRKEVKEIEESIFARLEAQEKAQQDAFAKQEATMKEYINSQQTLLKLPEAFAEMVRCDSNQVRSGVAKKVCDKLGLNDTAFDKAEKNNLEENDKANGGE